MAQSSTYPIISPEFCAPYPVDLSIILEVRTIEDGEFVVANIDGNILFKVKVPFISMHSSRVLLDAAGIPVVKLRRKMMSAHCRWQAFRGESKDTKDLLFTFKRSSMFPWKTEFDVFLAKNTEEKNCDYKVTGSWSERSCVIYAGESSTIVAQMDKRTTFEYVLIGKDNFMVTVYPNVDYGFIVALIIILAAINEASDIGGPHAIDDVFFAAGAADVALAATSSTTTSTTSSGMW